MTAEQYAPAVLQAGRDLGITPRGIIIGFAAVFVESDWVMYANSKVPESITLPHDAIGSDGYSVGLFQQQVVRRGYGWWWGDAATCMDPYKSARLFFVQLAQLDYNSDVHTPGWYAQAIQRSAYPDRYDQRIDAAQALYDRLADGSQEDFMGWQGDPIWLENVLREALGERLVVEPGWTQRGTGGQMGDIWGVMIHHTGNSNERVEVIRDGVQQGSGFLPGPLSQCLIKPSGKCHLIAVGPCNHAGIGSYPGLGANNGNQRLIGFECAWPTIRPDGSYDVNEQWPDAQIITMRDAATAIVKRLGYGADRVIGHKEYAGAAQGKWDPGNIDMDWFRREVAKDLRGEFDSAPPVVVPPSPQVPPPVLPPPANLRTDRELLQEIWDQLRGQGGNGWPQLGGRTLVDAIAEVFPQLQQPKEG